MNKINSGKGKAFVMAKNFKNKQRQENFRAYSLVMQIGVNMAISIVLPLLLGAFLDSKLGTSPWILLTLTILGVFSAFRNLFVITKEFWAKTPSGTGTNILKKADNTKDEKNGEIGRAHV